MATNDSPERGQALPAAPAGPDASDALARALELCCPAGLASATTRIASVTAPPLPGEELAVRGVSARRLREFAAGRACARAAMVSLGASPLPIVVAASREPVWPPGWVGSISHSATLGAALVGRRRDFAGIGLDIEVDGPLEPDVARIVCSAKELEAAAAWQAIGIEGEKLCFVIKEAFYKLYFPLARASLEFAEVDVDVDPSTARFVATLSRQRAALNGRRRFEGRFGHAGGHWFAVIALPCATRSAPETGRFPA